MATNYSLSADTIDVYNPDNYLNGIPHREFAWLRENAPVFWHSHPEGGGYWVVSKHADVMRVSRDHKTFSAQKGFVMVDDLPPEILERTQSQLLGMDPPDHGPIRRAVITHFTRGMLAELEPKVHSIAQGIVQSARDKTDTDFIESLACELPTAVICSMLDIPEDMWTQIRHWSDLQTAGSDPDLGGSPEAIQQASIEMGTYGFELAVERKASGGNDLICQLLESEVDGHVVSEVDFASLFIQLTVAGNETTRGLISSGMLELVQRPELYQQLEADPKGLPLAIEEMLRWTCPLHYFRRTATCDTEIRGAKIREGDRVVMMYSSANFDEDEFQNPMAFDISREHNPHMAFGYGIHLCLGANLARMEARLFFEEFFKTFKKIELNGTPARIRSNNINGYKRMPVTLAAR
ncbi:MAG: cytochrome P450 [Pseudomonadales bacterium]